MHRDTKESTRDPLSPGIGECDAGDLRQDVYPDRGNSNLIDHLLLGEGFCGNSIMREGGSKFLEGLDNARRILRRITDPHVKVLRVTRLTVFHDCKAAHDQVFSLKFV
jgi:hypothetical protein